MKMSFFFVFIGFFFLLIPSAESLHPSPFVWLVEKEGRTAHFLGTIHSGVSLEEMPCKNQILNQIQQSDLLFVEVIAGINKRLNREEQKKFYIGSKEEREESLSKLSPSAQEVAIERRKLIHDVLKSLFPFSAQSEVEEGAFAELSQEIQEVLLSYGVNPQGNHADFLHFIRFVSFCEASFSLPSIDTEILEMALSHSIEVQALDDNKQIIKDANQAQDSSNKDSVSVTYEHIEELVRNRHHLVQGFRDSLLRGAQIYKSYDNFELVSLVSSKNLDKAAFLKNRNELWLDKFIKAHREHNNIFLVVGLAHLLGNHNILDMLREKGFSVERMTCSQTDLSYQDSK